MASSKQKIRPRQWHPLFTREYPLYVADMAADAFVRLMEPAIGWGYDDALIINRRGIITAHYSEHDARRFRIYCHGKSWPFFRHRNALIRQRTAELNTAVHRFCSMKKSNIGTAFNKMHNAYQRLYSVYRFSPMVELVAHVATPKILRDCAITKELAGRAIKLADRHVLPKLALAIHRQGKIPRQLALYLRTAEIKNFFFTGLMPRTNIELKQRYEAFVYKTVNKNTVLHVGKRAIKTASRLNIVGLDSNTKKTIIKGQVAYRGFVQGRVVVVRRTADLAKVRPGSIFVSPMTLPTQIPWVKKAAAIVTDEGGITSHAAIVSRELGIPCLIGTKIATKVFKDGDLVEVDANQGVAKKI